MAYIAERSGATEGGAGSVAFVLTILRDCTVRRFNLNLIKISTLQENEKIEEAPQKLAVVGRFFPNLRPLSAINRVL